MEISDPELRARLALSEDDFDALLDRWLGALPARPYSSEALAHGLGYPWQRPARSYVLHDDTVELLDALDPGRRREVYGRFLGRAPLLAIGSNGAPDVLRRKFAHFEPGEDRDALVIAGHLHDFDVGAAGHLAAYGALPATLFPSPGARVRTAILWLTEAQYTQLVWSELSYAIGTLRTRFAADEPEFDVGEVVAFVSRFGAFAPGGEPVALAAVPAQARSAPALTQQQLLTRVAELVYGRGGTPEQLVRHAFEEFRTLRPRLLAALRPHVRPFASERWTPLVTAAAG